MSLLALPAFQLSNTWLYPIIGSRIGFIPQLSHNIIDLFYNWSHNSPSILQHFSGSTPCNRWSDAMALLAALTKPPVPPLRPVGSRGSWSSWIPLVEILQKHRDQNYQTGCGFQLALPHWDPYVISSYPIFQLQHATNGLAQVQQFFVPSYHVGWTWFM